MEMTIQENIPQHILTKVYTRGSAKSTNTGICKKLWIKKK